LVATLWECSRIFCSMKDHLQQTKKGAEPAPSDCESAAPDDRRAATNLS
jgi:hypothetical protein